MVARERLLIYGLSGRQLDGLVQSLGDDPDVRRLAEAEEEQVRELSRWTVVSPVDGVVVGREVVPGNFYDQTDILLIITPRRR